MTPKTSHRTIVVMLALGLFLSACTPIAESILPPQAAATTACPTSSPTSPPYSPPAPYPSAPEGYFWHGSDALWTGLPLDGVWQDLPRQADGYGQKLFVWRVGYDPAAEPEPALTVSGRRLDGDAPPLAAHVPATHAFGPDIHSAMLTGVSFPTAGCWEVTVTYTDAQSSSTSLDFVVSIQE